MRTSRNPADPLSAEERALWRRVTADVAPLAGDAQSPTPSGEGLGWGLAPRPEHSVRLRAPTPGPSPERKQRKSRPAADTLDAAWERRLRRGLALPERTVDLHGHGLAAAHGALEAALARALADEVRVLLVVTGRPPRPGEERRGAIRAAIRDWLAASSHASRIAAVRPAHPRHGGAGALYVVLRRKREGR